MQIKTTMKCHFTPTSLAKMENSSNPQCIGECLAVRASVDLMGLDNLKNKVIFSRSTEDVFTI